MAGLARGGGDAARDAAAAADDREEGELSPTRSDAARAEAGDGGAAAADADADGYDGADGAASFLLPRRAVDAQLDSWRQGFAAWAADAEAGSGGSVSVSALAAAQAHAATQARRCRPACGSRVCSLTRCGAGGCAEEGQEAAARRRSGRRGRCRAAAR
jgi:hypothetical protein